MSLRRSPLVALAAAAALAAGCSAGNSSSQSQGPAQSGTAPSPTTSATASAPAVPGYKPGEIPPIPLFTLPPIGVFAQNADKAVIDTATAIASVPGITVAPAACDGGSLLANGGNTVLYGDGSGYSRNGDQGVTNYGDGSGTVTDGPITLVYYGDGSGNYTNSDTNEQIVVYPGGSGNYNSPTLQIVSYGDGSGHYYSPSVDINRWADGSGNYSNKDTGDDIQIDPNGSSYFWNDKTGTRYFNYGNGSGYYTDDTGLYIINNGDGTATVNGDTTVPADPLPPVQPVGAFPPVAGLTPSQSCGTAITLDDSVLFDFGESTVRADAADTLAKLAGVLTDAGAPTAHVYGHTDSVGDDASNQTLSEQRAKAVVDELKKNGATTALDWKGFGETQPVAPNTNDDGTDNPAGRQANRRVEIFIPTF